MPFDGIGFNGSPWGGDELHFSLPFPLQPGSTVMATCHDFLYDDYGNVPSCSAYYALDESPEATGADCRGVLHRKRR
jgi:hypothetical protein